ncbi:GntR family transcriptional regulator [Morganella morganii]|uniref:GntR family transcriptional regulator n=1 Tax=Morganella morganii TaxID=582 RepID=A0A433ZX94_MORMO|nr:UTRA domain-containing protein [Morganella morganii]RUT66717.1 GntR family transcriptional regulator [Morganella morganii]
MKNTQTAADLAREKLDALLTSGIITPGDKLPAERPLTEQLGVNRMSLRQALLSLENDGKIFRKNRSGWFAALPKFNYNPKSPASFNQAAKAQGRLPSWEYTDKQMLTNTPADIAETLGLAAEEPVCCISGWGALDGHKVFWHQTYINPSAAPDFAEKLDNHSFAAIWENEYHIITTTSRLAFKPARMPESASKAIGCTANSPGIRVEKYRCDEAHNIVQIDIEYWRFESVYFFVEL